MMKFKNYFNLKKFIFRFFIFNLFSFVYLSKTYVFDMGFISIQSLIYSLNIYLLYFFIFFESICALLNNYGLDLNFYKLVFTNLDNLNIKYVGYILFENINIIYFLLFSFGILIILEKTNYYISFRKKFFLISGIIAFSLSIFNPSLSHQKIVELFKGATNSWSTFDRNFDIYKVKYYNQLVKNNIFRNDNWYNSIKLSIYYHDTLPSGSPDLNLSNDKGNFKDFGKVINQKNYNNIYVIINESYPNFRNQDLKKNLFEKLIDNNNNIKVKKFRKGWNRSLTTQGAEMDFFCNKNVDYEEYLKLDLKNFVRKNDCWINNIKNKNLVYIHSYSEDFFDRFRYRSFFNDSYFREELYNMGFKECKAQFEGVCDHEILNKFNILVPEKENNFVVFLTVNNHVPAEPIVQKNMLIVKNFFH